MSQPMFDMTLLNDYMDNLGGEIVFDMVELFIQQSTVYIKEIELTATSTSSDAQLEWKEACHKMKGSAGSMGLKTLHALLVSSEKFAGNSEEKTQLVAEINQLNDECIVALRAWIAE
jgi:HPt (histidine-containing phosphotransfer) domain-containing protein